MNRRQRRRRARNRRVLIALPPVLLATLYLVGLALPAVHSAEVTRQLPGSPETVWAILMDLDAMPAWRTDLRGLERLPDHDGSVRWREETAHGERTMRRLTASPPERLVVGVDEAGRREWEYRVERRGQGSLIAITERVWVTNPFRRPFVAAFGLDRDALERIVDGLEARAAGVRQVATRVSGPVAQSLATPQRTSARAR